jgi:hypothetical protein
MKVKSLKYLNPGTTTPTQSNSVSMEVFGRVRGGIYNKRYPHSKIWYSWKRTFTVNGSQVFVVLVAFEGLSHFFPHVPTLFSQGIPSHFQTKHKVILQSTHNYKQQNKQSIID